MMRSGWARTWRAFALKWDIDGETAGAFEALNRAGGWDAFTRAIERFAAPSQNFVYADVEGNIGYAMSGVLPVRSTGVGMFPSDGPSGEVLAALACLAPEHRAVIVLRHLLEFTPGEIAQVLGLPRGTVNSRLRRGLDALAEPLRADVAVGGAGGVRRPEEDRS